MKLILIDFIDMTVDEQKLVLDWRNDPRINQWMLNQDEISKKNHLNFVEKLKKNNSDKYWLVKDAVSGIYLGVIYLNSINNKDGFAELGLYTNPNFIGKGFGVILLNELKRIAKDEFRLEKLTLEVLKNNIRAINLYKRNGFKENESIQEEIEINGKNYSIVEMHVELI